jgi:hypothetical protein
LAAALVSAAVWWSTTEGARAARDAAESASSADGAPASDAAIAERAARTASAPLGVAGLTQGPASLSGKVLVEGPPGTDAPTVKIEVRPSRFVKGKETAVARDVSAGADRRFATSGLPYGAYRVQPLAPGYSGASMEVKLEEGARHADLVLRLRRNALLTGFVRDATRAPVEKVLISIAGKTETGEAFAFEGRTASDGSFRVESLPDGGYTVNVGPPAVRLREPTALTVRNGETPPLVLDVPELGAIEVKVLVQGVDAPVEGVLVSCVRAELDKGGEVEALLTDVDGRVEFRNLLPGKYAVNGSREYFKRMTGRAQVAGGKAEAVRVDAIPVLDALLDSLQTSPKPESR